jgi:hypothetical protein
MGKKQIIITALIAALLLNLAFVAASPTLKVQKISEKTEINIGDSANLMLNFTNPFDTDLPIKVVDKNVLGNNGLDIQCIEYTLPANAMTSLAYDPIKPYNAGKYDIDTAKITYTNPKTGKEETVESNKITINVKGSAKQAGSQGITTVYRCNGVNMQSTSFTSFGQSQQENQENPKPNQEESPANKIQNNQQSQNTNPLKQEIQQNQQQQSQTDQAFQQNLARNPEFLQKHNSLINSGYNVTAAAINAQTSNTGSFDISYANSRGGSASLKGEMENGTIKKMMSQTSEEIQKMLQALYLNKQFQKFNSQLIKQGFNASPPKFEQKTENLTTITTSYAKNLTPAAITSDYQNDSITNVQVFGLEKKGHGWMLIAILTLTIAGIISWATARYFKKKKIPETTPQTNGTTDYVSEARKMLDEAERLFANKAEKDAHEKVAQAVRLYFSIKLEMKKEITSTELLTTLRKIKSKQLTQTQRCLNLCSMVEFAKQPANHTEFNESLAIAREIVS